MREGELHEGCEGCEGCEGELYMWNLARGIAAAEGVAKHLR